MGRNMRSCRCTEFGARPPWARLGLLSLFCWLDLLLENQCFVLDTLLAAGGQGRGRGRAHFSSGSVKKAQSVVSGMSVRSAHSAGLGGTCSSGGDFT